MTFTEAATLVLRLVGKPLHFKEITDVAIERNLLSHVGKNPEVTMGARLSAQVKKTERDNPLVRIKPGVFALAEWDEKTIERGLSDRTPALEKIQNIDIDPALLVGSGSESAEDTGAELAAADEPGALASVPPPPDEEEVHRAELSALGTDLFDPEEDDDQPIFGATASEENDAAAGGDRRGDARRRRRRKRGRRGEGDALGEGGDEDLPAYTVSDAPADELLAEARGDGDASSSTAAEVDLTEVLEKVLGTYDPGRGPVSSQALADALRRQPGVDRSVNAAAVVAVAQAEIQSAERQGRSPRFRVASGKVALAAWGTNGHAPADRRSSGGADRLRDLERSLVPLREATVRALSDHLGRMSQRAFGDLVNLLFERMGVGRILQVKRPGAHGSELHLSGRIPHITQPYLPGDDPKAGIPIAICVRRDGKDIGRERVTELRGALHHYGPASQGWLVTAGQVLSGAREEAVSAGGSPMMLLGRLELAELCVAHGVLVRQHRLEVPVVDTDMLEGLSGR